MNKIVKVEKRTGKIDLSDIINQAVESIKFVDSWNNKNKEEYTPKTGFKWTEKDADKPARFFFKRPKNGHTASAKRTRYERIYIHIRKRLYKDDGRKTNIKDTDRLSINTIQGYNAEIRNAIKAAGIVGIERDKNCNELIQAYPDYKDLLSQIKHASADTLKDVISSVRKKISSDNTILSEKVVRDLKKRHFENLVVRRLHLSEGVAEQRINKIANNLRKRKENEFSLSLASIKRIMGECLASNRFDELAVGIALATGRRAIEVVYAGNFSKTRNKKEIKFTGQVKASRIFDETPNIIPMLVTADTVIDAVQRLRKTPFYLKTLKVVKDNPEVNPHVLFNRRMANALVSVIRKKFDNDDMVFHTSRVIATKTALKVIHGKRSKRKFDDGMFIAIYTGHSAGGEISLNNNQSYEHVHVLTDEDDNIASRPLDEEKTKTKEQTRDIQIMKDLIDALQTDKLSTNRPFLKWYDKLIKNISLYPFELTQRNVRQGYTHDGTLLKIGGGHVATVKKFEHPMIKDHIERYNSSNLGERIKAEIEAKRNITR